MGRVIAFPTDAPELDPEAVASYYDHLTALWCDDFSHAADRADAGYYDEEGA